MKLIMFVVLLATYAKAGVIWSNSILDDQLTLEATIDNSVEVQRENLFEAIEDPDDNNSFSDEAIVESRSK